MAEQLANNAAGTLSANMLIGATSLTLNSGQGAAFPSTGNFRILVESELMLVGARSGDTLSSITRGIEGTAAAAHNSPAAVKQIITAAGLLQYIQDNSVQKSSGIADGEWEVYRTSDSTWQRSSVKNANVAGLAPGTNGQYLTTSGGVTVWGSPPVIAPTFLTGSVVPSGGGAAIGANNAFLVPITNVVIATTISRIAFRVFTQSGNMDVGVYYSDDELTFTRLFSTGSFAVPAAGMAYKSFSSQTLNPVIGRRWYLAAAADNGTATFHIGANTQFGTWLKATSFPLPASITSASNSDSTSTPWLNGMI